MRRLVRNRQGYQHASSASATGGYESMRMVACFKHGGNCGSGLAIEYARTLRARQRQWFWIDEDARTLRVRWQQWFWIAMLPTHLHREVDDETVLAHIRRWSADDVMDWIDNVLDVDITDALAQCSR